MIALVILLLNAFKIVRLIQTVILSKILQDLLVLRLARMVIIFIYFNIHLDEWINPSGYDIYEATAGDAATIPALKSVKKCYTCSSLGLLYPAMKYCDRCSSTTKYLQGLDTIYV